MMKLTHSMQAALDLLAEHGDCRLKRTTSQWWVPDSDPGLPFGPEQRAVSGRLVHQATVMHREDEPTFAVSTATVHALVRRKLMKFTGTKQKVLSAANRKDYWRAELTPAALALRTHQEHAAAAAAQQLLRKVTTPS